MNTFQSASLIATIVVAAVSWMPTAVVAAPAISAETRTHLDAAMRGEAYEYLLYRAYAMQARLSGNPGLAKAFEDVADQEGNDHFMREAVAAGAINGNVSNLENAAKSVHTRNMQIRPTRQAINLPRRFSGRSRMRKPITTSS